MYEMVETQSRNTMSRPVDCFLQSLVEIVNDESANIPITLSVGGLLISGDMIGGRTISTNSLASSKMVSGTSVVKQLQPSKRHSRDWVMCTIQFRKNLKAAPPCRSHALFISKTRKYTNLAPASRLLKEGFCGAGD